MKRRYLLLAGLIISTLFLWQCKSLLSNKSKTSDNTVKTLPALTNSEQKIATTSQTFGIDLFKNVDDSAKGENVFLSPLSLSMALAMTTNGAKNNTRTAMMKTLEMPNMSVSDMNASYQNLIKLLINADPNVKMEIANSIWYQNNFNVLNNFIQTCENYYGAKVKGLDFGKSSSADTINHWVSDKTHGHIQKMVRFPFPPKTVMYLMNAIYFKGNWRYQFDKKNTQTGDFTLSNGSVVHPEMMHMTATLPMYQSSDVKMIDMAYGDSLYSMTVLLPLKGTNIDQFVSNLTQSKLNTWIGKLSRTKVDVTFPRFKISYKDILNGVLQNMGMGIAFSIKNADFTNINPDKSLHLHISQVKQKSYIDVDETGTEAAAVTSISMVFTSVSTPQNQAIPFVANRPFVYLIRERSSGTILFIGKMENPVL